MPLELRRAEQACLRLSTVKGCFFFFFFEMYRIFSRVWSDHAEQEQAG